VLGSDFNKVTFRVGKAAMERARVEREQMRGMRGDGIVTKDFRSRNKEKCDKVPLTQNQCNENKTATPFNNLIQPFLSNLHLPPLSSPLPPPTPPLHNPHPLPPHPLQNLPHPPRTLLPRLLLPQHMPHRAHRPPSGSETRHHNGVFGEVGRAAEDIGRFVRGGGREAVFGGGDGESGGELCGGNEGGLVGLEEGGGKKGRGKENRPKREREKKRTIHLHTPRLLPLLPFLPLRRDAQCQLGFLLLPHAAVGV